MDNDKTTPGPWKWFNDGDLANEEGHMVLRPDDNRGVPTDADAALIAAAPTMFKEIQETRERLDGLMKKLRGTVDEDTMTALATIEMDLNRVVAIADGSWPGVHASGEKKGT